ncbi:hypothetical protein OG873_14730 [Streptomyces violaceus]|uniref:hypothetical protein n=1 Tax=Streptomyces violaceus TaxID=1936 RepID=UPI002E2D72DE|nr:hypothetical protein [Streptomyces violaceus]
MSHRIARLVEPLLRFLLPGLGRRRLAPGNQPPARSSPEGRTDRDAGSRPLRGQDNATVRPYPVAHERREEARRQQARQQARQRALRLAVHGTDIGPRVIHGVEVTA